MKITTRTITAISLRALLFGAVIFAVSTLQPTEQPTPVSVNEKQTQNQSTDVTIASAQPVSYTHRHEPGATSLSPKHEEIKATIAREYTYRMFATPNDAGYASDWSLAKINASTAWDISTGDNETVIAIVDSGYALQHEELASRWHINDQETGMTILGDTCWTGAPTDKQTNNCDDDSNGYVDDWRGWSFILGDNNPQAGRENPTGDGVRHGTQVASLAGATTNNNVGIASLAWNAKIMPLQALDDNGSGYTSDITAAVYYAVDNGADVINFSLGAYANDPALRTAINYAIANDVIVIAASGNCGNGGEDCVGIPIGTIAYPAAYPDVIAVGASTSTDQRAIFSSYGPALDVMAPGNAVPMAASWSASNGTSLYSTNLYGTSFSSPITASLAALIKSIRPSTTVADVTALITATATKPATLNGALYSTQLGHGVINATSALTIAQLLNTESSAPTLLQAGSYKSEHSAPANTSVASGCSATGGACTVYMTNSAGHKRYLPYSTIISGATGWSWSSSLIDTDWWAIRAQNGENISDTPYYLMQK